MAKSPAKPRRRPKYDTKPGDSFGFLTVLTAPKSDGNHRYVQVRCNACGTITRYKVIRLFQPGIHSCGCRLGAPRVITYQGKALTATAWAKALNITIAELAYRLAQTADLSKALCGAQSKGTCP